MLLFFLLSVFGCDSSHHPLDGHRRREDTDSSVSNLAGTIKINGSSTVLLINNAVAEEFGRQFPSVDVNVDGIGTGTGFEHFERKMTDVSAASRPISPGELKGCRSAGVEFIEVPIAYDGLTVVIHPDNDWATTLTLDQLRKLFVGSEAAATWSDVDPSWPDERVRVFAPGTGSGSYDYMRDTLVGDSGQLMRGDMNLNEDDHFLVNGVAGNKFSIGFFGVAYYRGSREKLRAVSIVSPIDENAYLPTQENIGSGDYAPFSRPLFLYVSTASLRRVEVATFTDYFLKQVPSLCERVGYVRLPKDLMARAIANLQSQVTGTHYVDASGKQRRGYLADIYDAKNLNR